MTYEQRRRLLETLKTELEFLEEGSYRHPFSNHWRAQFIFEDSPTCMNYCIPAKHAVPCSSCVLMPLIPAEHRSAKWPCRQIPLSRSGETLDALYGCAEEWEIEITLWRWLQARIQQLENQEGLAAAAIGEKERGS